MSTDTERTVLQPADYETFFDALDAPPAATDRLRAAMARSGDLNDAVALACTAHRGQIDQAGAPYILHVLRVCTASADEGELAGIAGALHDVVEDGGSTIAAISDRFGAAVGTALDALTRRLGETYRSYIARCRADPIARVVKLADLRDNLGRPLPSSSDLARRYPRALESLSEPSESETPRG